MAIKWLLAVLSVLLVCCGTEAWVICVCPDEQCLLDKRDCLPFQVLIQEQKFSPSADIKFGNGTYTVSGNDSMNYNMVVRDISNIHLVGDHSSDTIIECDGRLRLSFINITNLTITDIQFVSCGVPSWQTIISKPEVLEDNPAALLLVNVHTLLMSNVVITFSQGYGMLCINLFGESHIMNTNFISNNKYDAYGIGGSILLFYRDSSVYPVPELVSILVNNCTFSNCAFTSECHELDLFCPKVPSVSGLGIVIEQSQYPIHVVVNQTNFIYNYVPTVAVYSHTTQGSYNILVQHSYFKNVVSTVQGSPWQKRATIMFFSLLPMRANTATTVTRMIDIHHNVFSSHHPFSGPAIGTFGRIDYGYKVAYIDITVLQNLNVTIAIRNCVFLGVAYSTTAAIRIYYNQEGYPDYDWFMKSMIIQCNFTGFQEDVITVLKAIPIINVIVEENYRHAAKKNYNISDMNLHDQISLLIENTTFVNNTNTAIKVAEVTNLTIANSQFIQNKGAALESEGSVIYIRGTVTFLRNKGFNGGAISLTTATTHLINPRSKIQSEQMSLLNLHPNATLLLINNSATNKGGAIYVDTGEVNAIGSNGLCFYQLVGNVNDYTQLPKIIFVNNTANIAGNSVYGGLDKECHLQTPIRERLEAEDFFTISNQLSMSEMATDPDKLCFCRGSAPNCSISTLSLSVHQGQTVHVNVIAVGGNNHYRNYGASPALVIARVAPHYKTKLRNGQYGQYLENRCNQLAYTVYSRETYAEIQLFLTKSIYVGKLYVNILGCPFGFQLEDSHYPGCVCETIVQESGCTCSIDDLVIFCPFGKWIGHISSQAIVHHHCPFDYCTSDRNVRVTALNEQCTFNHSGLLCGECQPGLSLGFGSSKCKECTNVYILLIVPFTLAGLGLVLILFACNLTVSKGTVNGLIYFANVVQVNSSIFVTQNTPQFLAVFVAWVNLDLGIQTCFYNGMDMYAKAWLQFVFPVYIWLIVAAIVLLSRHSVTVSRLTRDNTVPVLATLFLLSYAKLLHAIIIAFSFTYLRYPDGTRTPVWMYDGSVPFAKGKHTALLIATLVAMFGFIIPYALLLLLSPYLQSWSHYKPLRWVNKLKPFLDANHGPYKNKMRNWTGIILLARAVQFTCFAANAEGDPNINLMVILLIGAVPSLIFGTVYKSKVNSILESAFVLLLSMLASASLYIRTTSLDVEGKQTTITTSIFAAAFSLFLAIVAYHSFILIKSTASKLFKRRNLLTSDSSANESSSKQDGDQNRIAPTVSYVALSELSTDDN